MANGDQNLDYDYSPGIAQIMAKSSQQNLFEMASFFITHICHMNFFFGRRIVVWTGKTVKKQFLYGKVNHPSIFYGQSKMTKMTRFQIIGLTI